MIRRNLITCLLTYVIALFVCVHYGQTQTFEPGGDRSPPGKSLWQPIEVRCPIPITKASAENCIRKSSHPAILGVIKFLDGKIDVIEVVSTELEPGKSIHVWKWSRFIVDSDGRVYMQGYLG